MGNVWGIRIALIHCSMPPQVKALQQEVSEKRSELAEADRFKMQAETNHESLEAKVLLQAVSVVVCGMFHFALSELLQKVSELEAALSGTSKSLAAAEQRQRDAQVELELQTREVTLQHNLLLGLH